VYTNKPPCGPKRGHDVNQVTFAREVQLDKIAHDLGLDPVEVRLKQLMPPDSITVNHLRITSSGLRECLETVAEASGWREKYGKLPYGMGIGVACSSFISGAIMAITKEEGKMPYSAVHIQVDRWGTVTVSCGAVDIGQGSSTMLAAIVAEVLGLRLEDIRLVTADTDLTPVDFGSFSSRVTLMAGNAALEASRKVAGMLRQAAAARLEVEEERLVLAGGRIYDRDNPELGLSFQEASRLAEVAFGPVATAGGYRPPRPSKEALGGIGTGPSPAYNFAACIAQVAVRPETGEVKAERIWMAHDCGRVINLLAIEGQLEGSVYMGLGEALMEEQAFRGGLHKGPSMLDYKSLTTLDMPEIEGFHVESIDPEGPFGAKEAGEGTSLPIMAAVANAIHDAIGVRIDDIPITAEKVLKALDEKAKVSGGAIPLRGSPGPGGLGEKEGRYGPKGFPKAPFPETRKMSPPPQWQTGEYRV
ncbi:MAG TPA: molybdopterin cofactor-binding domain-containing protein, partial [Dehalococcoidia bacterium]|nr:molybdopterin cofactor-binding domain-containing protein [Dehalococcoidia bacterium]